MTERFVTSDLHFNHKNIIKYTNRPWTLETQTQELIDRWNSRVGLMDDVYHLGDFAFTSDPNYVVNILKQLNGNIHFIRGNHDERHVWNEVMKHNLKHVAWIRDYYELKDGRNKVCMMHYPLALWNKCHYDSWMLHGHSHGTYQQGNGKILDCGIDNHPEHQVFSWDEISEYMKDRKYIAVDHHSAD